MDDDSRVIKRVLRGDRNAFATLVSKYQRPIFNFIYRFFGQYDIATELTQDTFFKCYQSVKSFDQERKFSTWLYTIAKNICIDEYKKRKQRSQVYLEDFPESLSGLKAQGSMGNPQAECILREQGSRLGEAIRELEPDKKAALILYYFQGLSYNEISEALGIPLSTVKIRIFRAKKALLKTMQEA